MMLAENKWIPSILSIQVAMGESYFLKCLEILVNENWIFENNIDMKHEFTKYLKDSGVLGSDPHFSFKYFLITSLVTKVLPRLSDVVDL